MPVRLPVAHASNEDQDVYCCGSMESLVFLTPEEARQFNLGVSWMARMAAAIGFAAVVVACMHMGD